MFNDITDITIMSDYAHQFNLFLSLPRCGVQCRHHEAADQWAHEAGNAFPDFLGGSEKNRHGEKNQASMDPQLVGYVKALNGVMYDVIIYIIHYNSYIDV